MTASPPPDSSDSPDVGSKPTEPPTPGVPSMLSILRTVAAPSEDGRDMISIGTLVDSFGQRAFGILLFIFTVPNAFPLLLPGFTAILGIPVILLLWQIMIGRHRPWLPHFLRKRSFSRDGFARVIEKAAPYLSRVERYSRPRQLWLYRRLPMALFAAFMLCLSVVMTIPLPLTNVVPAIAISMWALSLVERDGYLFLAAVILGAVWLVVLFVVYVFFIEVVKRLFHW